MVPTTTCCPELPSLLCFHSHFLYPGVSKSTPTFHQTSAEIEPWLHHRPVLAPWASLSGSCTLPRFPSLSGSCTLLCFPSLSGSCTLPCFPSLSGSRTLHHFPSSYVSNWIRQGRSSLLQTRKLWLRKARWRGTPWSQKWFCVETSLPPLTSLLPR